MSMKNSLLEMISAVETSPGHKNVTLTKLRNDASAS